jgi:aminoglycoside 6-adenylyltransferase
MSDDRSMQQLENRVIAWVGTQPTVRAVLVVGSRARPEPPADEWSDLDLIVFATDFASYATHDRWLDAIGPVWVVLPFQTGAGDPERQVLFDGGYKVDFVFMTVDALQHMAETGTLGDVYRRGYRILLDKDGLAAQLPPPSYSSPPTPTAQPSEQAFALAVGYFWAGALAVARQLRRRNLWVAKSRDWVLKGHLLKMLEWHARAEHGWDTDTWYEGKFLAQWTDPQSWHALHGAFGRFDAADSWQTLFATMDLFRRLATETAARLGYAYPAALDKRVTQLVNALHAEDDPSQ